MTDKLSFPKTEIIRWVFTFCIGVAGAYLTINTQISNINSKLEILELRVKHTENVQDETAENYKEIMNSLNEIKLQLKDKADKKYIQ